MIEEKFQAVVLGAGESGVGAALLYQSRGISVMVSDYGHIAPKYKQELEANGIPIIRSGSVCRLWAKRNLSWQ